MRAGQQQTQETTERREPYDSKDEAHPFPRVEGRIENEGHEQQRDGHDDGEAPVGTLLALVFASPVEVIALVKAHLLPHFFDGLAHGATQVATAHAVLNGDIARISLAINI